jgi:hypothetical protein
MGAGTALVVAFVLSRGQRGEGFVELSFRQIALDKGDVLRFELPAGWWVRYNGHQPWRGGTIADKTGQPRIEVWLHEGPLPAMQEDETCEFPWGQVPCRISTKQMERPFSSFPSVTTDNGLVLERAFIIPRGFITFRVPADQDGVLKTVIWECLCTLRPRDG